MREVDRLLAAGDGRQERAVHEREVGVGEAGVVAGHPRAEEHLGEDRERGDRDQAGQARPDVEAGIGPFVARSAMKIVAASTVSAIARCAVTSSAARPCEDDRGAEQRLHDDEDAGHDRGGEQRRVAAPIG